MCVLGSEVDFEDRNVYNSLSTSLLWFEINVRKQTLFPLQLVKNCAICAGHHGIENPVIQLTSQFLSYMHCRKIILFARNIYSSMHFKKVDIFGTKAD